MPSSKPDFATCGEPLPEAPTQDEALRDKVRAAIVDPRPRIPAAQVFAELRRRHDERRNAVGR